MKTAKNNSTHTEAMKIAQRAMLAEESGDNKKAFQLYNEAYEMERDVAMKYISSDIEPTRSVLFRSAASLAVNSLRFEEAKELIKHGLGGNPPMNIAEELLGLHEEVTQKELDKLFQQKRKELDEFMKAKTKELKETMRQARAIMENQRKSSSQSAA